MREPFKIMVAVVGVVLLVACANVANLLLARGRARTREVAVRAAIGAPRSRIVRQLFTEGLLLGLTAAAAGLVLTQWIAASVLPALVSGPEDITGTPTGGLDPRVLAFSSALAVACSILFGLGPALRTARASLVPSLQEGARGVIGDRRRFGSASALVVAQVALSMLLLTAAGLLTWSAHRLQSVDPGFKTTSLLTFTVDTTLNGYEARRARAFFAEALERLRALPGVTHVSLSSHRLIANSAAITFARPEGPPPHPANSPEARAFAEKNRAWRLATDDRFHDTLGIPMLRGSSFAATPDPDGPQTAVVNARLARQLFGTVDAVGRRFVFGMRPEAKPIEITGVVADAHYSRLKGEPPPTVYLPYQQAGTTRATFNVRTAGDPMSLAETVRETMRRMDDTLPIFDLRTQEEQVERSIAQERLFARLALLLGAVALALSGIGVYGLLAYTVSHRTAEIGVRMAFGAERRQVQWLVLRQSLILIGAGLALGIPASFVSGRFVQSLLFELTANDPRAVSAAAILMASVGLLAAFVPAYRASRIDPLRALRAE